MRDIQHASDRLEKYTKSQQEHLKKDVNVYWSIILQQNFHKGGLTLIHVSQNGVQQKTPKTRQMGVWIELNA